MDIAAFLAARLDEDEAAARAACVRRISLAWKVDAEEWAAGVGIIDCAGRSVAVAHGSYRAEHIARWDPARVLAEVAAKRAIVADGGDVPTISMRRALRHLAAPYADHPDYDPAWAVDAPD